MKPLRFFLFFFICFSQVKSVNAQIVVQTFPSSMIWIASSDGYNALHRKLVVVTVEPDKKMMKVLQGKPILLSIYMNGIGTINNNMKEVINKTWKNGREVEYKTIEEIGAIPNKLDYIVAFLFISQKSLKKTIYSKPLSFTKGIIEGDTLIDYDCEKNAMQFGLAFLNDNALFFSKVLPDIFPTKTDLLMAMGLAVSACKDDSISNPSRSFTSIKNKTLLIRKDMLDSQFMTEDDVKKNCPIPFKIVSKDELDEHVMKGDTNYMFVYFDADYFQRAVTGPSNFGGGTMTMTTRNISYMANKRIVCIDDSFSFVTTSKYKEKNKLIDSLVLFPDDFKNWAIPAN